MQSDANIIARCKKQDRIAQKALYEKYAPLFYTICLRYIKNTTEAEDLLVESFFKIFSKIDQYKGDGSFEGWMKRIVINESLMRIRKNNNLNLHVDIEKAYELKDEAKALSNIQYDEIIALIDELPTGYRTVFNLYVIEGYKHREIAEQLNISINTSKSQLILAKKKLALLYKKKHNHLNNFEDIG